MKLYNTLSKQIELLSPISESHVSMYSCGPTVYDNLHIGNLSAFIYADTLRRVMATDGPKVNHVMNITDIDDKTIKNSRQQYPDQSPHDALSKLTKTYSDVFKADLLATGCDINQIQFISAVESIPDMIVLIQKIIDNGIAYLADDGVYFSIESYVKNGYTYGLFQHIEMSESFSRISNDEYDKENASDFALWKKSVDGQPAWDAEFTIDGKSLTISGRPGWHIECSAMSEKTLGVPFDIHTGGIDLKFPHHENEIAQTVASGSKALAHIFFHNGHILIDGKKMSKSLGNVYTLRDIESHGYAAQIFRLLVLESHYRNESNFTWEILDASQNRFKRWQAVANLIWQTGNNPDEFSQVINESRDKVLEALKNDLDTPEALKLIDQLFNKIEDKLLSQNDANIFEKYLSFISDTLGIEFENDDIKDSQKQLISDRTVARETKDWAESDRIRDELHRQGTGINDTPSGTIWFRL